MKEANALGDLLDELVAAYGRDEWADEVLRAREEFVARTGQVFEDDEFYEARMSAFLEWYTLERIVKQKHTSPVVDALSRETDAERREGWRAWATSHRSVFEVRELEEGKMVLADLVSGCEFRVDERRQVHGVSQGDVLEARVVGYGGEVRFGGSFLYHPPGVADAIRQQAERILANGGTRTDVVDHVASLRIRVARYRHVSVQQIYAGADPDAAGERERPAG